MQDKVPEHMSDFPCLEPYSGESLVTPLSRESVGISRDVSMSVESP